MNLVVGTVAFIATVAVLATIIRWCVARNAARIAKLTPEEIEEERAFIQEW